MKNLQSFWCLGTGRLACHDFYLARSLNSSGHCTEGFGGFELAEDSGLSDLILPFLPRPFVVSTKVDDVG